MIPSIRKNKKLLMIVGIGVACLILAAVRWTLYFSSARDLASKKKAETENAGLAVPAVKAFRCARVRFVDHLIITGTLEGGARVELRFNREGSIGKIKARVGDQVAKGGIIAELDVAEARIKLQQAESELSQAVDMYRSGAIAMPRLTQVRLAAELAREEYNRSYLKAPMEGFIGELNAEVGEYVTTNVTVGTLVSKENVFVEVGVIEKDLSKLHLGQTVKVRVETYPGIEFEGHINRISPVVEGTSRTRSVRAEIPNSKGLLLPGMFARCQIFIMEKEKALIIPCTALRNKTLDNGEQQSEVFVVDEKKSIQPRTVKIGYEGVDYVDVITGLEEGDRVVAQLTERIRDGVHVEVMEEVLYEYN